MPIWLYAIWCIHDYLFVCLDVWAVPGRVGSLHVRFQAGGEVLHINFSSVGEKLGASSGFDGKINLWSIWRNCAFVRRVGFQVIIPPEVAAEVFFVVFDQGKVEARITALLCTTGRSHTLISRLFGLRTHGIASLVKLCDRCTRRRRRCPGLPLRPGLARPAALLVAEPPLVARPSAIRARISLGLAIALALPSAISTRRAGPRLRRPSPLVPRQPSPAGRVHRGAAAQPRGVLREGEPRLLEPLRRSLRVGLP